MTKLFVFCSIIFSSLVFGQDCEFPYSKEWNAYVKDTCIKELGYLNHLFRKDDSKLEGCKQKKYKSQKVWKNFLALEGVVKKTYHWITVGQEGELTFNDNNCYNYAALLNTRTFAQPGRSSEEEKRNVHLKRQCESSYQYASKEEQLCKEFVCGAVADGLTRTSSINRCADYEIKVALAVTKKMKKYGFFNDEEYQDFHWYREDHKGYWTHKIGPSEPSDRDESGDIISNPETADRGEYKYFCSYFCVNHNKVKIE